MPTTTDTPQAAQENGQHISKGFPSFHLVSATKTHQSKLFKFFTQVMFLFNHKLK